MFGFFLRKYFDKKKINRPQNMKKAIHMSAMTQAGNLHVVDPGE